MENVSKKSTWKYNCIDFIEQHPCLCLSAILLTAFVLRLIALINLKHSIYYDFLLYDENVYHNWAQKIAAGTHSSLYVYDFAPLPAYVFAFIYKLFSPDPLYIRLLNIILGVLTCFSIYLVGKKLGGEIIGLASALLSALYKPFIFFSIVLQKTSLSLFLFGMSVYLFMSLMNNATDEDTDSISTKQFRAIMISALLLGLSIGLLINVRSNCILMMPLILVFLLWNAFKKKNHLKKNMAAIVIYATGFILAVSPFVIRNYKIAGEFSLTPAGGYNLYLANNPDNPYPYYRPVPFATSVASDQATQFVIEASRRAAKKLTPGEASSFWTQEVMKSAINRPAAFSKKLIIKLLAFFNRFESADNHHIGFTSDFVIFFKLPFFSFWFILPFGMAGMALTAFHSRKSLALFAVFIIYGITLVIFFTNIRIRMPALIILIPFAVNGVKQLASYPREQIKKPVIIYLTTLCIFVIVEFIPLPGTDDMTAYYNTHALNLDARGQKKQAIEYWKKSSAMNKPYSAYANISLAAKYFNSGQIKEAFDYINKIPDSSFAAASKYNIIGDMMIDMKQKDKGIASYEKSLQINFGQRQTHMKLFRLYWLTDKDKAEKQYDDYQYVSSFYGDM